MRTVVFVGCILIAKAIRPDIQLDNYVLKWLSWILIFAIVMDVVEFYQKISE